MQMAFWNFPNASGDWIKPQVSIQPADWPPIVMLFTLPPKVAMLLLTQFSPFTKSRVAKFPELSSAVFALVCKAFS